MYDELIKQLRASCEDCKLWDGYICCLKGDCTAQTRLQAADAIEELKKAVLRLEDESGLYDELPTFYIYPTKWISVTERLPEVGKKVLVLAYGNDVFTARLTNRVENNNPVFECNKSFLEIAKPGRITHWMPLPEAPKDGERWNEK